MLPLPGIELTGKSRFSQTFPIAFGSLFNKTLLSASRFLLGRICQYTGSKWTSLAVVRLHQIGVLSDKILRPDRWENDQFTVAQSRVRRITTKLRTSHVTIQPDPF